MVHVQSGRLYTGSLRRSFRLQPSRGVSGQVGTSRPSFISTQDGMHRYAYGTHVYVHIQTRVWCCCVVYAMARARRVTVLSSFILFCHYAYMLIQRRCHLRRSLTCGTPGIESEMKVALNLIDEWWSRHWTLTLLAERINYFTTANKNFFKANLLCEPDNWARNYV